MTLLDVAPRSEEQQYADFFDQLEEGQAGRLKPVPGETLLGVRRQLAAAAKRLGKDVKVRTADGAVYFWLVERPGGPAPAEVIAQEPEVVAERPRKLYIHDVPRLPVPPRRI
jgi:hypothetical protein